MPDDFATALSKAKAPKKPPAFGEALAMSRPVSVDDGRATPDQAATARAAIFGSADPDSQPAPDEMVDALLDVQGHGQRVESEIAKYSKELDRESFPGIFKAAPSDQALEFERMGGADGYRKAERDLAIERMGGRPTMGAARRSLSLTDSEARAAEDQAKIRQSENPILRYGARLATDFKEGYENAGAWVRESLIRPVAPEAARALDSLSSRAGMSEEGKAIVREDTKGLLGDIIGMVGQTAAFIPQVALGGVPGAAAVSAAASGGDVMAGLETAAFLKTAGGLTRLFGGASESVIRQVLAEGAAMTAAGAATRLGFHGDPGTLQQAGVDALSGLAFGVMGGGARAREAAARFRSGLEAGKTIETAAREAGIPPERLADPTPPVEAPRPAAADPVKAPEVALGRPEGAGLVAMKDVDVTAAVRRLTNADTSAPISEARVQSLFGVAAEEAVGQGYVRKGREPGQYEIAPELLKRADEITTSKAMSATDDGGIPGTEIHADVATTEGVLKSGYHIQDPPAPAYPIGPGGRPVERALPGGPAVKASWASDGTMMVETPDGARGPASFPQSDAHTIRVVRGNSGAPYLVEVTYENGKVARLRDPKRGLFMSFTTPEKARAWVEGALGVKSDASPALPGGAAAPEIAPQNDVVAPAPVEAPAPTKPASEPSRPVAEAPAAPRIDPADVAVVRDAVKELSRRVNRFESQGVKVNIENFLLVGAKDGFISELRNSELLTPALEAAINRISKAKIAEIEAKRGAAPAEAPAPRPVERPVEPTPPPVETPRPEGVSIKNESVNARREARGLEPVPDTPAQTFEGWNAAAEKAIAENPNKPYEVIADLKRTGRAHTPVEVAILTRHQVDLAKAYKKAADDVVLASERGDLDAVKEAKARAAEISLKDMEAAEVVGKGAGAEAARALTARKMTLAEDYSLLAMERKARVANDGKPLPEKTATEIKVLSERMEKIQGELDALKAARSATRTSGPVPTEPGYGKANKVVTPEAYAATKAALRDKLSRMSAGIDPTILADMVKMGTFHVEAGLRSFASWSKAMLDDLGEKVAPHLKDVWRASQTELGKPLTDAKTSLKATVEAGKRVTDNPVAVQKIAEHFVRTGVTERGELIEKVHEVLQASDPSITFRQTMDAISGYGAFKALDKDPAKIRLRELKAEMQQIGKLEDMAAGKAPAKTGVERQPMTDEARELSRKVNEEKRRGGYEVVDPERQLKSALDGVKTRLRNEIVDLERQIASKTKDVPNKTRIQLDEEAAALKARRDAVKAEFDAAFGTPGLTDAQRVELAVRAAERSVAALEKQIERGDVFPEPKAAPVSDPRLDALRARREELVKKREDMRASALEGSQPSKVQQSIDRAVASLDKSIAEYKAKLASGDIAPRPKGSSGPTSPKIEALKAERDSLRKQIEAARSAARPRLSPDQIALKSIKSRLSKQIADLENRIATSDFKKREKVPTPRDTQAIELEAKRDTVKREYETALMKLEWQNKSALQKAGSLALSGPRNLSRALMTAFDFSAPLRQGAILFGAHPIRAMKQLGPMFRAFASKEYAAKSEAEIRLDPAYHEAKKAGLFLSEHHEAAIGKMEENVVTGLVEKIPGLGASQRAYTTFLNRLRFDTFKSGLANLSEGRTPTPLEAKTWANYVNVATGRGGSPDSRLLNGLSNVFFAPRLAVSRFQILLGTPMWRGTGATRALIAKEYARSLAGLGVFYGLAKLAGGAIEEDGKVRFGGSVIDPLAGLAQAATLLKRTVPGLAAGVTGQDRAAKKYGAGDEFTALTRYIRLKAAPIPGAAVNLMTGKDAMNKPVTLGGQALSLVTPMSHRDIYNAMKIHGVPKGAALGLLSLFGMGLQNYEKRGR